MTTTMSNVTVIREPITTPITKIEVKSKYDTVIGVQRHRNNEIVLLEQHGVILEKDTFKEWVKALQELAEQL
jgi:hypothetical protein